MINHLKLFLNISMKFNPGVESIGEYLVRQGQELIRIGERMKAARSDDLEEHLKLDETDWETEGQW